ncbi:MAG: T9SS type A sorting domain-containing protein, partial [Candidatus Eisenbacteria bacterium]|nr:T9SS type A sorting domain-containing protein [Candidatus Eisenbacteria bacterium]
TVYAGGLFTIVRGQPRDRLAAIDGTSGALLAWDPGANDEVTGLVASDNRLFVHGKFSTLAGLATPVLSVVDGTTGNSLGWNPLATGTAANTVRVAGGTVFVGGDFTKVEGVRVDALAGFPLTALLDAPPVAVRSGSLALAAAPNPARGPLAVSFALAQESAVQVCVLDVSGRLVARLLHDRLGPGTHHLDWNGRADRGAIAPGVYLIDVRAGGQRETKRVVLTR